MMVAAGADTTMQIAAAVQHYNALLITALQTFIVKDGVKTWLYDTAAPFEKAIADPAAYSKSSNATCYNSDGVSCIWYNDYYPGQAIHKLVAEGVLELIGI